MATVSPRIAVPSVAPVLLSRLTHCDSAAHITARFKIDLSDKDGVAVGHAVEALLRASHDSLSTGWKVRRVVGLGSQVRGGIE